MRLAAARDSVTLRKRALECAFWPECAAACVARWRALWVAAAWVSMRAPESSPPTAVRPRVLRTPAHQGRKSCQRRFLAIQNDTAFPPLVSALAAQLENNVARERRGPHVVPVQPLF